MKKRIFYLLLLAVMLVSVCVVCAVPASASEGNVQTTDSKGEINVWLIGGQSNAAGYATDKLTDAKYDSRYTEGFDNILYDGAGDDNVKNEFVPLTVGLGNKESSVGAEVGVAKMLGDSNTMNAVIKFARGSASLYPKTTGDVSLTYGTWTSPSYIENNEIDVSGTKIGALYDGFISTVAEGVAILIDQGYTPVIRGMWWMQGSSESYDEAVANEYEELLTALIGDIRRDLTDVTGISCQNMPIVVGSVSRNKEKDKNGDFVYAQSEYLAIVNAAQLSVASSVPNVHLVNTSELPQLDGWHYNADGQQYLGAQLVKNVVYSEGKYSVSIDGIAAEGTGFGSYCAGETVNITVKGVGDWLLNKAYYVASGSSAVEIGVEGGVCVYSFTMPESDVVIAVETEDPDAVGTKYGNIPFAYSDASKYPFVLFKNGAFFDAYEDWNSILNTGNHIFLGDAPEDRAATLLLRRDYNTTEMGSSQHSQNLYRIKGHIDFDLGGFALTRGGNHLFQVMAKDTSAKAVSTSFTIYNGTLLAGTNAPLVINSNGEAKADDHFYFTFEGVNFGFASGATSTRLVFETYANGTFDTIVTAVFNNCSFNAKTNAPSKSLCIFDLDEGSGALKSADITVNGGKIVIGDISKVAISALGTNDNLVFGEGSDDAYTVFNLSSLVTLNTVYNSPTGDYLTFSEGKAETDGTYSYALRVADVEVTEKYGAIDNTLYPVSAYPFVLFEKNSDGSYTFRRAYAHYYDFLLDLRLNTVNFESVLYLRSDYTIDSSSGDLKEQTVNGTKYSNIDRYFYYLKAPLTIDLNQKTLTRGGMHSLQMMGNGVNVTITVKNGTLHTKSGTMIAFNNTGAKPETTVLNFDGVTFTSTNVQYPFIDSYTGGTAGTVTTAYITFTNCTFDISNLSRTSGSKAVLFDLKDTNDWIGINITFIGGKFISGDAGYSNVNLYTVDGENDSLVFKKGADGSYTKFEVKKGTNAPSYSFISGEAGSPSISMFAGFSIYDAATSTKTHNVYFLDETVSISSYNGLPESLTGYTFLVFNEAKDAFAGYNTWYEIWFDIWTLRKADNLIVLMLKDYDTDNCAGSSQDVFAAKNMVIDLNGHTLTRGNKHIFQIFEKGTNTTYNPNIIVKNGTICSKKNYATLIYFNSSGSANGIDFNLTMTFDGVTFTTTDSYIGRLIAETNATNGVNGIEATLTFNDCSFIINSASVDSMFTLNDTNAKYNIAVVVNGGSITFDNKASIVLLNNDDSFTFGKYNGSYTKVLVKSGVALPGGSYYNADGVECVFVKASENDGYVNYSLYPEVMVDYKIKTSITLWSNFVYNVYIPAINFNGVKLNGLAVDYEEVEIDGVVYYHVTVNLPAGDTLSDINLCVTLNTGSTTVDANWTLNVYNYTKSVLAGEFDDTTKTLMKDMLVYASAAHTYFDNTTAVADKLAEINTLLGDYTAALPTGEAKQPTTDTYFTKVEVYVGEVPSFRFYLADGYTADDFTFKVGKRNANVTVGDGYVEIVMYAYMMLDDVTFTVIGTDVSESYNLYSYYAYAKTLGNANLTAVVEALMKYSVSAKAYRDAVIGA